MKFRKQSVENNLKGLYAQTFSIFNRHKPLKIRLLHTLNQQKINETYTLKKITISWRKQ